MSSERQVCTTTFDLNNGSKIPAFGLGAMEKGIQFTDADRPRILASIVGAIRTGYRLIDTSMMYGTEALVGEAVRASGVPRSEITVVTKLPGHMHHDPKAALEESLKALDVGYVDVYLMHWPCAMSADGKRPLAIEESPTYIETYKLMEELVGPKCKTIGVSNFTQRTLEALLKEAKIVPVVNQIELHPLNPCLELVPWCHKNGIRTMAWAPLAGGPKSGYANTSDIYTNQVLTSLASHYDVSISRVILSWLVQRGVIVIPHSSSPARLSENIRTIDLTDKEVDQINGVHREIGQVRLIENISFVWYEDAIPRKGKTIMGWTPQEMGWVDDRGTWLT